MGNSVKSGFQSAPYSGLRSGPNAQRRALLVGMAARAGMVPGPGATYTEDSLVAQLVAKGGMAPAAGHRVLPQTAALVALAGMAPGAGHRVLPQTAALVALAGMAPAAGTLVRSVIVPLALHAANTYESNVDGALTSPADTYETGTLSPAASRGLLAAIFQTGTACNGPTSITAFGLTWVLVASNGTGGSSGAIFLYRSQTGGSAPTPGTFKAVFAGTDLTTGVHIHVTEETGVDLSGTNGSAMIVQSAANSAGAQTAPTMNTLATFGNVANAHYYVIGHAANEDTTVATGFTEIFDAKHSLPSRGMEVGQLINGGTPNPSWATSSTSRWVQAELRAA